jgi:dTDP-4-amino-4,6-dideoxygalactose transaminase
MSARLIPQIGGSITARDGITAASFLFRPRRMTTGPAGLRFERLMAEAVGASYAFSFWASRVGLYATLDALGIGEGDDVLLQAPTNIVVPNAIRLTGARVVYVDCTRDTYNIDFGKAEAQVTPQTKALVLQHTFGIPADIDAALDFVARHRLVLIEDCVHGLGSTYRGRPIGSFGRAAIFSTEATKTISTTLGGFAVTNDPELAARLERFQTACSWPSASVTAQRLVKFVLASVLTTPSLYRITDNLYSGLSLRKFVPASHLPDEIEGRRPPRYEERLSNAQAALGMRQLERLDANLRHRRRIAGIYTEELGRRGLHAPSPPPYADTIYLRYPLWVRDRETALKAARPIARLGTWFTSVLEDSASPSVAGYVAGSCPVAEEASRHLVNLPTHERVRPEDAFALVSALEHLIEPAHT